VDQSSNRKREVPTNNYKFTISYCPVDKVSHVGYTTSHNKEIMDFLTPCYLIICIQAD